MAEPRPTSNGFDLAGWVAASCARQGVPVKITDARVVTRVAVLLSGQAQRRTPGTEGAAGRRTPPASQPPHRPDPAGIQTPSTAHARTDDGMVKNGPDDGVAAVESQLGPLAS